MKLWLFYLLMFLASAVFIFKMVFVYEKEWQGFVTMLIPLVVSALGVWYLPRGD